MDGGVGSKAIKTFEANVTSLQQLIRFDDRIIDLVLEPLENLHGRLVAKEINNERLLPTALIKTLRNIKKNESLKGYYKALYNQWLVLLVSYFGSAVKDLFVDSAANAIRLRSRPAILRELLEAPVEDFAEEHQDLNSFLAELLASSKDISFQDMQSIGRAFTKYFGFGLARDVVVNDVILAQACRNSIVHAGGIVDRRLIAQLRGAHPRSLKSDLSLGQQLKFSPDEIQATASAMVSYLSRLDDGVRSAD